MVEYGYKSCLAAGSPAVRKCQAMYRDLYYDCYNLQLDCQKKKKKKKDNNATCENNSSK